MYKYLILAITLGFLASCSSDRASESVAEASFKIDGMTCQMGCANAIEEKLASLSGVEYAEVNFSENEAVVKYSIEIINKNSIVNEVESLGGGDKYKVSEYKISTQKEAQKEEVNLTRDEADELGVGLKIPTRISFPNVFFLLLNKR